jgi:hypothetical protein
MPRIEADHPEKVEPLAIHMILFGFLVLGPISNAI